MADELNQLTMGNVTAGIYRMYRGISRQKLSVEDVQIAMQDEAIELVQDLSQGAREQRTQQVEVTPQLDNEGLDFIISVPQCPDFVVRRLEYSWNNEPVSDGQIRFRDVDLPNFDGWPERASAPGMAAQFYGSSTVTDGIKVTFNRSSDFIAQCRFILSYRLPLYRILGEGDVPPFPQMFIPYFRVMAGIRCYPAVRDDSKEFTEWWDRSFKRTWEPFVARGMKLWQEYRDESGLPTTVDQPAYNDFRKPATATNRRAYFAREPAPGS